MLQRDKEKETADLTAASDKFDGWKKEGMGRESEVSSICGCFGCLNGKRYVVARQLRSTR